MPTEHQWKEHQLWTPMEVIQCLHCGCYRRLFKKIVQLIWRMWSGKEVYEWYYVVGQDFKRPIKRRDRALCITSREFVTRVSCQVHLPTTDYHNVFPQEITLLPRCRHGASRTRATESAPYHDGHSGTVLGYRFGNKLCASACSFFPILIRRTYTNNL